jgi:hypothetical protein
MPGDPAQCRIYAARYLELSKRAKDPARGETLAALAETWTKLAAELEADKSLLNTLYEINLDEPFDAVPEATMKTKLDGQALPTRTSTLGAMSIALTSSSSGRG